MKSKKFKHATFFRNFPFFVHVIKQKRKKCDLSLFQFLSHIEKYFFFKFFKTGFRRLILQL